MTLHALDRLRPVAWLVLIGALLPTLAIAQGAARPAAATAPRVAPPVGYVIGADDVLDVVFWRDKEMSAEAIVRPDGFISLPLLNDVQAAGLTPDDLRQRVTEAASRLIDGPTVTIVVKQINSRKVFITGNVERPAVYPLATGMTVLQLIATAGGLKEFADAEKVTVIRTGPAGALQHLRVDYDGVISGKKPSGNVVLMPGDTVVVP